MAENRIITNQFVEIEQTPAGIGHRIFARLLDYLIMGIYIYGLVYTIDKINIYKYDNATIMMIVVFVIPLLFYTFLFEMLCRGRTLGKMAFGMRVVMRDGTTPTIGAYFMRWIFLLVDVWLGLAGLVVMLINRNNRRTGDLAAGTIVIKERDYHRISVSLDEFEHLSRNHRPQFPQAENLSLEQINIISEALERNDVNRRKRIATLAEKVKDFLKINPQTDDELFLKMLIRDFQYYAMEETV